MPQVAILGAGIAGLSSAWMLKKQKIDFIVLEKQSYIGGLARSFLWNGFHCDFAAHRLFTTDETILQEMLKLVPMGRHIRRSRIFLAKRWMRDPLDLIELGLNFPMHKSIGILWKYIVRPRNLVEENFQNYVIRRYGKSLYQLFFQPYTEKLFGIPGDKISVYWAQQKVRLANPLDNFRENTKTKFQYFYYPIEGGYGAIVNNLYNEIKDNVQLETQVIGIEKNNGSITSVLYEHNGLQTRVPVDYVISTLPFSITSRMLDHPIKLSYRKVDAVFLLINRPFVSDYHWVYFIDDDISINRLIEFKNMSAVNTPHETSVLCAEVTQNHQDVARKVVDDLTNVGFINRDEVLDTKVVSEDFSYPIYDLVYDKSIKKAQSALSKYTNLYLVGRAAEFRHREADDNFAAAKVAVNAISQQIPSRLPEIKKEPLIKEEIVTPKVTAVILSYNHYQDTKECLESVLSSDYQNFDVVLTDNGSSDDTPQEARLAFPSVHIIELERNLGVPAGYNVGFRYALEKGADYILMLNNDTVVAPEMLSELIKVAKDDQNAGIIMPKVLYYGSQENVWSSGGRYRSIPPAILMTDKREAAQNTTRLIEYAPSCGLLIHRKAFQLAGLFDPGYFFLYDDWDFSERVRAHGLNIWYAANAQMWHKVSTTIKGSYSSLYWQTFGASIARFYRRHGRPVWFSLPVHLGYVIIREIIWKRQWANWPDFWQGIREGLQKPLGNIPQADTIGDEKS